jgi:hypothetical protein
MTIVLATLWVTSPRNQSAAETVHTEFVWTERCALEIFAEESGSDSASVDSGFAMVLNIRSEEW